MRKFLAFLVLFSAVGFSQNTSQPTIHITERPPEPIPAGTCKEDLSGYIGTRRNGKEEMHLTDKQLGEYVRVRLSQGYSINLYPQISGKIFAITICESVKR